MQFGAFLHDYWYCKQKKLKTGEVQRTVRRTSPIWLKNIAYSCLREWKLFFKMAAKLKYKRTSFTSRGKPITTTFPNPLRSHWFLPLKEGFPFPRHLTGFLCNTVPLGAKGKRGRKERGSLLLFNPL
jgi:hypothetical protein